MYIVGAGMAGLLAAAMLRNKVRGVLEAQEQLPNNHSALLRFRSSVVADTVGIPFKKVNVLKAVEEDKNPVADAIQYSLKTNGNARLRSILSAGGGPEERYIAPTDFIKQLSDMCPVEVQYNTEANFNSPALKPMISTVPMPVLMSALGWKPKTTFRSRNGYNIVCNLDPDIVNVYCTLYVPSFKHQFARISITGSQLIAECYGEQEPQYPDMKRAMWTMGLSPRLIKDWHVKRQKYAKILPCDESERREFVMWATQTHGIYSLGRFATWRPGLLLDDIVNDVRVIQRLEVENGERYEHLLKTAKQG